MSLKLIPVEKQTEEPSDVAKQKGFNPLQKRLHNEAKKTSKLQEVTLQQQKDSGLKNVCMRLVHYINRGSRFTYEQVDELIVSLHRGILGLQKKKQEIIQKNGKKNKKK